MTFPRFYAPDLDRGADRVILPPDESHHLVRVLRLARGDHIVVFDGRGGEYLARVESTDRQAAGVSVIAPRTPPPDPAVPIVLVQAVLKADKMDGVIRDATMAGVSRVSPVVTERSQVKVASLARGQALDRWQRIAISSAKQCGRARLPIFDRAVSFSEWLELGFDGVRLLLVEPSSGSAPGVSLRDVLEPGPLPAAVACIVGPEGGWSEAERGAATDAGCAAVSLGPMTLRADAAGLVAAGILSYALETRRSG